MKGHKHDRLPWLLPASRHDTTATIRMAQENDTLNTADAQQQVAAAVAARGYTDGYTLPQLQARQMLKMQEELGELFETVKDGGELKCYPFRASWDIASASELCRLDFDRCEDWRHKTPVIDVDKARKELADVVVVALTLAESLGFDVVAAALEKSTADIARGVR